MSLADRYIYLEDGKIRGNYTKEEFLDLGAERRLKMGLRCFSMDEEEEKEAEKILDKLDLLPLKEHHPMSLSGGQKQRVAIASAIASGRKYLFFDEPTSGLDFCHMQETAGVLKDLLSAGITSYVVTHDFEMILSCCTAVIHLENGEIQETYPVDEAGIQKLKEYFIK